MIERKWILTPDDDRLDALTPYRAVLKDLAHLLGKINERQGLQVRAVVFADTTHVRCGDVHWPGMKDALRLTHALSFRVTTLLGLQCSAPLLRHETSRSCLDQNRATAGWQALRLYFHNQFNFHRDIHGQLLHAHGRARMPSLVAVKGDQEVRGPINDPGLLGKILCTVDHP